MLDKLKTAVLAAEFLGTALLVMVFLVLSEITPVSYFVATSVAITMAVIMLFFGWLSGAHVNPAVTFGMWVSRKISTVRAAGYVVAQLLGGLAAWQLYQYLADKDLPAKTLTYDAQVLTAEAIGAGILVMGFMAAAAKGYDALISAVTVGAAIFVGIMIASIASTGYINPAVAVGLRSIDTAYIIGPLVGGLVGASLYAWLFTPGVITKKKK